MTPKEKAKKLLEKMTVHHWTDVCDSEGAKQCALIAVDEILHSLSYKMSSNIEELDYYNEVRQEIEKL
jgi:hypothetical protein